MRNAFSRARIFSRHEDDANSDGAHGPVLSREICVSARGDPQVIN
jgi:hypothetical protein